MGLPGAGGTDFTGADLTRVYLNFSNLTGCTFRNAQLQGADLTRCDLTGAVLVGAGLTGANLSNSICREPTSATPCYWRRCSTIPI